MYSARCCTAEYRTLAGSTSVAGMRRLCSHAWSRKTPLPPPTPSTQKKKQTKIASNWRLGGLDANVAALCDEEYQKGKEQHVGENIDRTEGTGGGGKSCRNKSIWIDSSAD